ncbi:hypothetical protein GGX14DRAFT_555310 [Mycena pura]|uniref:RlpA-like protein double-psi beta-barrel domain-containing protein n=1 Tax=Mycena pura TaxID=153505 RepID=A0AAD6YRD7_9AGAR|nr:hypothetical protein GGX14DRAFT_555310 [Mycena pura]
MRSLLPALAVSLPLALAAHVPRLEVRDPNPRAVTNSQWTFFSAGLGACGELNSNSDFASPSIVALDQQMFGPVNAPFNPICNQRITMTFGGKTAIAVITDICITCPPGGLDLTPSLFSFFAPLSEGLIFGAWDFVNASASEVPLVERPVT